MKALEIRGSSSSRITLHQAGMGTAADLMTLQQQIRQEIADSLQRVHEEMHMAVNGRLDAVSNISSAMQRLSAGPAEMAKPHRISDLIPKSWDSSHDTGQLRNFMAELHLWMHAWSDQGDRTLWREGRTLNTGCRLHGSRLQMALDDNKRTSDDGSTSVLSERI